MMGADGAWRPVYSFPEGITDASGQRLRPGAMVRVTSGSHAGEVGEIVGWGGTRGVEVLTDTDVAELLNVPAGHLQTVADVLRHPVTPGGVVVQHSDQRAVIVLPLGAQDVQPHRGRPLGPFPDPDHFKTTRGRQEKVDARGWGEACVAAIADWDQEDAAAAVAEHLAAPILSRVLDEAAIPERLARLAFVVTDQPQRHRDDTAAFGELLRLWTIGAGYERLRHVDELVAPVVLRAAPHLVTAVTQQVAQEASRCIENIDVALVVHAGGTPAMTYGTLFALLALGVGVRHVQVPVGQPLLEIDVSALIERAAAGLPKRADRNRRG